MRSHTACIVEKTTEAVAFEALAGALCGCGVLGKAKHATIVCQVMKIE